MYGWTGVHRHALAVWVGCLAAATPAWGQDPYEPDLPPPALPGDPPPLIALSPTSFREHHIWNRRGPPGGIQKMSDVAHFEGGVDLVAAATLDGAVWLWLETPSRSQWTRVLDGIPFGLGTGSQDEDLLQEFESALGDLTDEIDTDLESTFVDDPTAVEDEVIAESVAAAEALAEAIRAELTANPEFVGTSDSLGMLQAAVLRGDRYAARPRVWFAPDGRLFVGRIDGLWLSADLGESWRQVLSVPVTALAHLDARGLWVAGTGDGVRFSTDGVAWIDVNDGTEGLRVYDLSAAPEGMYAGTADGLWFAHDAQSWGAMGTVRDPVLAVLTDPDWYGGLWFATEATVWRSDDGGDTARGTSQAPLPGVVEMIRMGPGRLLVAGSDGPWETLDGATTWVPLPRGLTDPDTRGIDVAGHRVFVAGDEGLFELMEILPAAADAGIKPVTEWIPVETLIGACLSRRGLADPIAPRSARAASSFLPGVSLEGYLAPAKGRSFSVSGGTTFEDDGTVFADQDAFDDFISDLDADQLTFVRGGTTDQKDLDWHVTLRLEWKPEGRKSGGGVDAFVVDGNLLIDDGGDRSVLTAKVNRGATAYKQRLISDITSYYFSRQTLVARRPVMLADTLVDQVELEIQVQELEAYLDAITDGAVSRYDPGSEQE